MPFLATLLSPGPVGKARFAVNLAFFNLGAGAGLWAVFIPVVSARLDIGEGTLGLVLLAIAAGSIAAMPATGWVIALRGSHAISAFAAIAMPLGAILLLLAPSLAFLFAAAILYGGVCGALDVAMNNEAARVEASRGRPTMSSFHALFSVGGLAGAAVAAPLVDLGSTGGYAAAGILVALAVTAAAIRRWYLPPAARPPAGFRFTLPSGALLALGLLAFLSFGLEGAVADWSALYLVNDKQASPAMAAAGYAAFAGAMALMRFQGDRLVARFGRTDAIRLGGIGIAAGCGLALLAPWPLLSAVGFGLMGVGAANIVPVLLSAAARFPASSGGVAAVSTIGYFGSLIWPPAVGSLAQGVGLHLALWLIAAAGVIIAFSFRVVARP